MMRVNSCGGSDTGIHAEQGGADRPAGVACFDGFFIGFSVARRTAGLGRSVRKMKHKSNHTLVGCLCAFITMILIASIVVLQTGSANIREVTDTIMGDVGSKAGLSLNSRQLCAEGRHGGIIGCVIRLTSRREAGSIGFPSGCVHYGFDSGGAEIWCNVVYHDYEVYCIEIEHPSNRITEARNLKEAIRGQFHNMRVIMKQRT